MGWNWPTELETECPHCDGQNELTEHDSNGIYQGYCEHCGEWFEVNYDEALQSEFDEQRIDQIRDERLER